MTFVHFVYGRQFVVSSGSGLFRWLLALVLWLSWHVLVFDFDDRLEDLLVRVAAACVLFVGS